MALIQTQRRSTLVSSGAFQCPVCAAEREYVQRRVQDWGVLFTLPIVPRTVLAEYVECAACLRTFPVDVLSSTSDTAEIEASYLRAIRRVMVRMMMADGVIDPGELIAIREVYRDLTGYDVDAETLLREADEAQGDPRVLLDSIEDLLHHLNEPGREYVLEAAYRVAMGDHVLQESERAFLVVLTEALDLPAEVVESVLDRVRRPAR